MFITEEQIQFAFDTLNDPAHSKARAAYEFAEKRLKVVLAKAQLAADGKTVGERDANAQTSPDYEAALVKFRQIAEAYHWEKDRREAARAITEAWRTQQSDLRAVQRIA